MGFRAGQAADQIVSRERADPDVDDVHVKQALIEACGRPGILMTKLARDCGFNAKLLNT